MDGLRFPEVVDHKTARPRRVRKRRYPCSLDPGLEATIPVSEGLGQCCHQYTIKNSLRVAFGNHEVFAGMQNGSIGVFERETGIQTGILQASPDSSICQLAYYQDPVNPKLVWASAAGVVKVQDVKTAEETFKGHSSGKPECIGLHETWLYCGASNGILTCWNMDLKGKEMCSLKVHLGAITGIFPVRNKVYTCSWDGLAKCVDAQTAQLLSIYEGMQPLSSILFAESDRPDFPDQLFCGTTEGRIKVYDAYTCCLLYALCSHIGSVKCLFLQSDQSLLFSGAEDGFIKQWDLRKKRCEWSYEAKSSLLHIEYNAMARQLLSASLDRSIQIWNFWDRVLANDPATLGDFSALDGHIEDLSLVLLRFKKFSVCKEDGSRALDLANFGQCLASFEIVEEEEIETLFAIFDSSGDGNITANEVVDVVYSFFGKEGPATYKKCFRTFDRDGSGEISSIELGAMATVGQGTLKQMGISKKILRDLEAFLRSDAGGSIDFEEFQLAFRNRRMILALFPLILRLFLSRVSGKPGPLSPSRLALRSPRSEHSSQSSPRSATSVKRSSLVSRSSAFSRGSKLEKPLSRTSSWGDINLRPLPSEPMHSTPHQTPIPLSRRRLSPVPLDMCGDGDSNGGIGSDCDGGGSTDMVIHVGQLPLVVSM